MIRVATRLIVVLPALLVVAKVTIGLSVTLGMHDGEW